MTAVMRFFEMRAGEFRTQWNSLPEQDKSDLKAGVADGSLTYPDHAA